MQTVILKTRIKNTSGQDMLFRWIAPRGQYLTKDQEVIVDGAYPTAVQNRRFVSSCEYDIVNGRVEAELVTNIRTRKPTGKELSEVPAVRQDIPAAVPPPTGERVELTDQKPVKGALDKEDERWQQGTIEGSKPKPITLPGHEQTLADAEAMENGAANADGSPKTLEIFPEGTDLGEDKRAEDETVQAEAKELATANADGSPKTLEIFPAVPPVEAPADAPADAPAKKKGSRKTPRKTSKK